VCGPSTREPRAPNGMAGRAEQAPVDVMNESPLSQPTLSLSLPSKTLPRPLSRLLSRPLLQEPKGPKGPKGLRSVRYQSTLRHGVVTRGEIPRQTCLLHLLNPSSAIQGYLAHKKQHPPRTLQ